MITINLLPIAAFKSQLKGKTFLAGYGIFISVLLFGLFAVKSNILDETLETLEATKNQAEASLNDAQKKVKAASDLSADTARRWQQLAAVVELEERRRDQTRLLVEVEDLLPKSNAWLLSLSHSGGALSLEGISTDKETVSQFLTKLENASYIDRDSVVLVQISQNLVINGVKLTKFSIKANTVFPQPRVLDDGLPDFGLPSKEDFIKTVKAADEKLANELSPPADTKKGI